MTRSERTLLESHASQALSPLVWQAHADPAFTVLRGRPCPFLDETSPEATCCVYNDRPMNCRRFACYRPDPATELLEPGGPLGCQNALDRFRQSPAVQADYRQREQAAQTWAFEHGWPV